MQTFTYKDELNSDFLPLGCQWKALPKWLGAGNTLLVKTSRAMGASLGMRTHSWLKKYRGLLIRWEKKGS